MMNAGTWLKVLRQTPMASKETGLGSHVDLVMAAGVLGETILCLLIVLRIAYTEIDWIAYMQEVEGFLQGERNYYNLKGDTGPLVYPAGFVYIYSALYYLTDRGRDIGTAQYIFVGVYVSMMAWVLTIYRRAGAASVPLWAILLTSASRRVHSIFVLRLFNDGIAMWLLFAAVGLFLVGRWRFGCALYSAAVGVKMNILLFAPGLLLLLLQSLGLGEVALCLGICAVIQLALGAPFLLHHPVPYLLRAFDLRRVFMYKWTVNFKFLSEELFVGKPLSLVLLAFTAGTLALFAWKWLYSGAGGSAWSATGRGKTLPPAYIAKTLFVSNFIGVVFCRSLHYQGRERACSVSIDARGQWSRDYGKHNFYSWYFHTLPFLLWHTDLPTLLRLAILAGVEYGFNICPATPASSLVLQVCHLVLLAALWAAPVLPGNSSQGVKTKRKGA